MIEGAAHDQDGRWRNLDSEGKGVRISFKSNSEDRSSWLCHGRRGCRRVQVMEIMRLCLAIRDGVVCIGRGHCSDGPIPLYGSL